MLIINGLEYNYKQSMLIILSEIGLKKNKTLLINRKTRNRNIKYKSKMRN